MLSGRACPDPPVGYPRESSTRHHRVSLDAALLPIRLFLGRSRVRPWVSVVCVELSPFRHYFRHNEIPTPRYGPLGRPKGHAATQGAVHTVAAASDRENAVDHLYFAALLAGNVLTSGGTQDSAVRWQRWHGILTCARKGRHSGRNKGNPACGGTATS